MKLESGPVAVRLSDDALHLEVLLAPDALVLPTEALVALIQEHSARLGVHLPLRPRDLEARLASCRRGAWLTLLSGTPPTPARDGRVELLVPIPVLPAGRDGAVQESGQPRRHGVRQAVRAGTLLARLRPGTPGSPGCDLLGRAVAPRPPRETHLPQGENTHPSADGADLLASCDGEVMLRHLRVHVVPMHVHEGDLSGALTSDTGVFVTGSVHGARVSAAGDVHVAGDAHDAQIESTGAGISVAGSVSGTAARHSVLRARSDIACGPALHADLRAGRAIHLRADARHSTLAAAANLYLQRSIEESLLDVHLHLGGGIMPTLEPLPLVPVPTDRQHFRVQTQLQGALALHAASGLAFHPCTIGDLSAGGARCSWEGGEVSPGTIVQLKLALPGHGDHLLIIARASRAITPGVIGLAFLQMTREDQDRLTQFCLQLLLARKHSGLPSRASRR